MPPSTTNTADDRPPQRDNFPAKVRMELAQRVGWLCSNPDCQRATIGPRMGQPGANNLGVAAHIKAASLGFARYDVNQSEADRKSFRNGIWLCQTHAHQIDYDENIFTVEVLEKWKADAEQSAFDQLTGGEGPARIEQISRELREELITLRADLGLLQTDDIDHVKQRVASAAADHLQTFQALDDWPSHIVETSFQTIARSALPTFNIARFASALQSTGEIVVIAPPGTGKSTAMVRIARALLTAGDAVPLLIPLQEWAESNLEFLPWLANRQAFAGLTSNHLGFLAQHGAGALLLDGWNEIPLEARRRATIQVKALRRELPLLAIILTTRPQVLEVPLVDGRRVSILPLTYAQQRELAHALGGSPALATLERARAVRGLRELMAIPLYLKTLVRTATDGRLPETKEAILRSFVEAHEADPVRAEVLHRELSDQHAKYLTALAINAHVSGNTTISAATATISVGQTSAELLTTYQIQTAPNPTRILDVLVSTHALQTDAGATYGFQHHQFQEWYASKAIEAELYRRGAAPFTFADPFVTERINPRAWEEALLFACERMSRKDAASMAIIKQLVLVTLQVDPMLAAAMIRRSAGALWDSVAGSVIGWATSWHAPGKADRAITFMIGTGRPEFADLMWPVVTNSQSQIRLQALRGGGHFDMTVLGQHLDIDFAALPDEVRESLIAEMIHYGGVEEEEKAAALAMQDASASVRIRAIESLLFEGAVDAAEILLRVSRDDTVTALAERGYMEELNDATLIGRLAAVRQRLFDEETNPLRKAAMALHHFSAGDEQRDTIRNLLTDPTADFRSDQGHLLADIASRYPAVVDEAFRMRIERGLPLPWRFEEEYLTSPSTADAGPIRDFLTRDDLTSDAVQHAAVLAGPQLVTELCRRYVEASRTVRLADVRTEAAYAPVKQVTEVLGRTRREVLLSVVATYDGLDDPEDIRALAYLLASQGERRQPDVVSDNTRTLLASCLDHWARTVLESEHPDRNVLGEIAGAMRRYPHPSGVAVLADMLQADLSIYAADRAQLVQNPTDQALRQRVTMSYHWTYRDALTAIGNAEAQAVLTSYLGDDQFFQSAATGLVQLQAADRTRGPFANRPDYERAAANRLRRIQNPQETSAAGRDIFAAARVAFDIGDAASARRAASLAAMGALVPHGSQDDLLAALLHADLGPRPRLSLLTNMAVGGYALRASDIRAGLDELLDLAAREPWQLGNDNFVLGEWLALFALSEQPQDVLAAIDALPPRRALPVWNIRDLLAGFKTVDPSALAPVLLGLVQRVPELRSQYEFFEVARTLPIEEMFAVIEAAMAGDTRADELRGAGWDFAHKIASRLSSADIAWLKMRFSDVANQHRRLAAEILAALGAEDIFLYLADDPLGRDVIVRSRAMRVGNFATATIGEDTSIAGFTTREYQPADCSSLRRALFHMTLGEDSARARFASGYLTALDELRDEDGPVETEPRHPDIAAQQPWPSIPTVESSASRKPMPANSTSL
jgi:hypothetical protein